MQKQAIHILITLFIFGRAIVCFVCIKAWLHSDFTFTETLDHYDWYVICLNKNFKNNQNMVYSS